MNENGGGLIPRQIIVSIACPPITHGNRDGFTRTIL